MLDVHGKVVYSLELSELLGHVFDGENGLRQIISTYIVG
jgi:hypothetical protein